MNLDKWLHVENKQYALVHDDVFLQLNSIGNASFVVQADIPPTGLVIFDQGYSGNTVHRYFLGFVEKVTRKSNKHYLLYCRELSAALEQSCPISLRECKIADVLKEITKKTKLHFSIGDGSYSNLIIDRFQSSGSGFDAIFNIFRAFQIVDGCWQQLTDGSIYVGSWQNSEWHGKNAELTEDFFTQQTSLKASIPCIPALRPGAMLNNKRLEKIRTIKHEMKIQWKP